MGETEHALKCMRKVALFFLGLSAIVCGCGTTDTTQEHISAPPTTAANRQDFPSHETYVGGQIFKIDRTRPLPNAFGGADIFGRKVFAGYTELRYQGLTDDGKLILRVTEVETHSTETTMSRSGYRNFQGNVDQQGNFSGTISGPPKGFTELLPPNTTQFVFDATKEKELSIAGMKVRFLEFTPQSLKYSLEKK